MMSSRATFFAVSSLAREKKRAFTALPTRCQRNHHHTHEKGLAGDRQSVTNLPPIQPHLRLAKAEMRGGSFSNLVVSRRDNKKQVEYRDDGCPK